MSIAAILIQVFEQRAETPALKRLRVRLAELGEDARDEVEQLRQLQKACREDPALHQALVQAGLPDLSKASLSRVDPAVGEVVQALNLVVEEVWARRSMPPSIRER